MFVRCVLAAPWAAALALTGCLGNHQPIGSEYRGVYRVDTFTDNPSGCDVEGPSSFPPGSDHLVAFTGSEKNGRWVWLSTCADVARCRAYHQAYIRGEGTSAGPSFFMQFDDDRGDHLEGGVVRTGVAGEASCQDAQLTTAILARTPPTTVRIEARTVVVSHPLDEAGMCTTAATRIAAEGKPCMRLRVITATFVDSL